MLDEHPNVQSPEEHGAYVPEIDRNDPGGLGAQDLPSARARAPVLVDARGTATG